MTSDESFMKQAVKQAKKAYGNADWLCDCA